MTGLLRVLAFAATLAIAFAVAAALGRAVGPLGREAARDEEHAADEGAATAKSSTHGHAAGDRAETAGPPGLAVAAGGLRVVPLGLPSRAGRPQQLSFSIVRDDGTTLAAYDVEHERRMHVIVVRRDLTGFQHLHPTRGADGMWTVTTRPLQPGAHRVFADFSTGGRKTVLGFDVAVPGRFEPQPLPAPQARTGVEGYEVFLDAHRVAAGEEASVSFAVLRGGREVAVDPYLGARGHLVVLREADLAYLHTHPEADALEFETTFPSAGRYRAFLQFSHGGRVHTAAFTVEVPG